MNFGRPRIIWGFRPDTLYRYIAKGSSGLQTGKRWKLRKTVLDRWMERKMSQARPKRAVAQEVAQQQVEGKRPRYVVTVGKQKQLVGLDIGSSSIKAVELKEKGRAMNW